MPGESTTAGSRQARSRAVSLSNLLMLLFGLSLLASAASFSPFGPWWLDLPTHFRPQLLLVSLLAAAVFFRRRRLAFLYLVTACAHGFALAPAIVGHARIAESPSDVRILVVNVHTSNQHFDRLLQLIEREEPDILVLLEVDDFWMEALSGIRWSYPFRLSQPRSDNFGIAVWSRLALDGTIVTLGRAGVPSVVAVVAAETPFLLVATHPLPPVSAANVELRDDQLDAVAATAAASELPVVVAGDLNATGWSPILRRLQRDGGLRLSTRGWVPTWPVGMPVLWVPLDHVLHSPGIGVVRCVRSDDIGSDHYPLVVDLRAMRP